VSTSPDSGSGLDGKKGNSRRKLSTVASPSFKEIGSLSGSSCFVLFVFAFVDDGVLDVEATDVVATGDPEGRGFEDVVLLGVLSIILLLCIGVSTPVD
jgi:hypothetical protein